jgi:hypothetical protein
MAEARGDASTKRREFKTNPTELGHPLMSAISEA